MYMYIYVCVYGVLTVLRSDSPPEFSDLCQCVSSFLFDRHLPGVQQCHVFFFPRPSSKSL